MMARRILALSGATIREIGTLVVVFAPLESYLRGPEPPVIDVTWMVTGSLISIAVGIIIEVAAEAKK
jgi:hypothetical protein